MDATENQAQVVTISEAFLKKLTETIEWSIAFNYGNSRNWTLMVQLNF